jgi:hypothetical protein
MLIMTNKAFLLHYRNEKSQDYFMIVLEKNKLCARTAASYWTATFDDNYKEVRNYDWLSHSKCKCYELKYKGDERILFYKDPNQEFNYLKGKLV